MGDAPSLVRHVRPEDVVLLGDWRWLVPEALTPLFITALGDWIFGAPDGSLWLLEMLEGSLSQIAANAAEYKQLKSSEKWLDESRTRYGRPLPARGLQAGSRVIGPTCGIPRIGASFRKIPANLAAPWTE